MLADVINRMAEIKEQQSALKIEYSELEGEVLKASKGDLENTKLKSVTYPGVNGSTATVTMADSLKVIYPTFLKKIFGEAYGDVATEKLDVKISDPAKRMLTAIWKEDYTKDSFDDILKQLKVDDKTRAVLAKKLKGANFAKDKENLIAIGKLDDETADQYAFFLSEAVAWDNFMKLLSLNGEPTEQDIETALTWVKGAVIVEETPKVGVDRVDVIKKTSEATDEAVEVA